MSNSWETGERKPEAIGSRLARLIESSHLPSIRIRSENLNKLTSIERIVIVGSSATGKSTVVDQIREAVSSRASALADKIEVPKRVITRVQRENDNFRENTFAPSEDAFEQYVQDGLQWRRFMEGERVERYGFEPASEGKIPVYSGNNAIVNDSDNVQPADALRDALIVAVYAPDEVREERLEVRSPDLSQEERAHRQGDRAVNMYSDAHIVVKNYGRNEDNAPSDVIRLVELVLQAAGK
jgi:ribose 1,5-bisphosphokinase PhnN